MSRARRRSRSARLTAPLAAATLLAGGVGTWALTAATAQAAPGSADARDDFNGDGYADLVVGAPDATVSSKARAGYVAVVYGSAGGLSTSSKKIVSRSTSGVPGAATANQRFGATFTKGDLDRDGFSDLVIGGGTAGSVVLWGSASGLTGGTALAGYGASPQAGDFDGDGKTDLALFSAQNVGGDDPAGAPAALWKGPVSRAGKPAAVLNLLDKSLWWGYEADDETCATNGGCEDGPSSITGPVASGEVGDVNGDGKDDIVQWTYAGDGEWANRLLYGGGAGFTRGQVPGADTNRTGTGTGIGDVNGDGFDDVVVGADGWNKKVRVAFGSASGLSDANVQSFDQDLPGFPGVQEQGDALGTAVSVGDVTGDGYADIALGIPGEDFDGLKDAGSIALLHGSASGVTGTGAQTFHQNTAGISGVAEKNDRFGVSTALLDVNGNGHPDLAASSTAENASAGAVWVLRGTTTGLTTTSALAFGPRTLSAPDTKALFGSSLR
ncbi:FG-GAP-like repeat-containing protein [Streptomyces sp. NPDC005141]